MMTCVLGEFFLLVDCVHFLIRVVDENIVGACLNALYRAVARSFMRGSCTAFAIGDVPSPGAVATQCGRSAKQQNHKCHCKTSHRSPPGSQGLYLQTLR